MTRKTCCLLIAAAVTATVAGCAGEPTIQTGDDAEVIMGSLNRVDNSRAELVYVDPAVDYRQYQQVRLLPLDLDHVELVQPGNRSGSLSRLAREWELTEQDREQFKAAFRDSVAAAITQGGVLALTEETGPGVLAIEAMITRIAPNAVKDDVASRPGRSYVYTEGAGSMSITIAVTDAYSGDVLALIKDTRDGQNSVWGPNNRVQNMAEVRRMFGYWGRQLEQGLRRMRDLSEAG